MSSSKPIIVLKSSQDWDEWFFIVQSRAKKARVYDYIDPTKDSRPQQPIAPTKPPLPTGNITDADREEHKWKREDYKEDKKEYDRQMRELNDLLSLIEDSVSQPLLLLLRKVEDLHPYAQLRLTSTTLTFHLYTTGVRSRGVNVFLKPIMQHDLEYASPILRELRLGTKTLNVSDVIIDYREHARQKQALTMNKTRTTFAATLRGDEQPEKAPKCLCGNKGKGKEPKPNTFANDDNSDDEQGSIKFTKTRNAGPDDFVIYGNTRVPIKSFGNIIVNTRNGKKSKVITLRDVAYVLVFMGNLVSISKYNKKDVYMDTKSLRLYKDDTTVVRTSYYECYDYP
ncbi:Integrase catalytic core [Botryosphaeria dothidea]|uniref:Integrase catalytic core n=1 Tax=Botryosphaeria dothidea TaxID=55169 RepID=A0A8H4J0E1_9PEZI|nr:Integrase catalytic core [Botryosphaeria dothidea]